MNQHRIGLIALTLIIAIGCGKNKRDCSQVSVDQRASFMAVVDMFPLHVTADSRFNDSERQAILTSVDEWNKFGRELRGENLFTIHFAEIPEQIRQANPQDCGTRFGETNSFFMLREHDTKHWESFGLNDSTPAATMRCVSEDIVVQQMIYIKPNAGLGQNQVQSVVNHELGHALGLDHSCAGGDGNPEYVSCNALAQNHPYRTAVMYPVIRIPAVIKNGGSITTFHETAEIKNILRENDRNRASCLYNPANVRD